MVYLFYHLLVLFFLFFQFTVVSFVVSQLHCEKYLYGHNTKSKSFRHILIKISII
ncbi:hypothetical protein MtrunA17_Chr1g0177501 [Medicago truncatula]|uniref:Transmembrane protein n=1 Tax=Medicago truncatula TaxID=3880 RepID=A0A396JPT7_MEDTR|nr:hypothetical protein MtrunA17_Chr1g0177501 [Medicago truncatula]